MIKVDKEDELTKMIEFKECSLFINIANAQTLGFFKRSVNKYRDLSCTVYN